MTRRLAVLCLAALAASACSPPDDLASGVNSYSTDIVLGSQTKPAPPPFTPLADPAPIFPGFIVSTPPSAPPAATVLTTPPPPPTKRPTVLPVERCPVAGPQASPSPVSPDVTRPPTPGVYAYRQRGSFTIAGAKQTPLPPEAERTLTKPVATSNGGFRYDLVIQQFGSTTTTTYEFVKRLGQSDVDGIYITKTVMKTPGKSDQLFEPVPPGLRILPVPARVGTTFRSVATDPTHGTTTTLEGTVKEIQRVDACGELVDGFFSQVKIATRLVGAPENSSDITIDANYIIATQLGGLIVADNVSLKGTQNGKAVTQQTDSIINSTKPERPLPK